MNAIQFAYAIGFYTNLTHASRFYNIEANKAMNDAIMKKIDSITDTDNPNSLAGLDRVQKYRDELYTLIKTSSTAPTVIGTINSNVTINHKTFPTDYQTFVSMNAVIDSATVYCRETDYNKLGPMLECSFRKPNNSKPFFLQDATGLRVYRGIGGTISAVSLDYIKIPAIFNMALESQYIAAGTGVLSNTTVYIAVEESVHNGITRQPGDEFTTANTNLTSGLVVLKSLTTTCDLPEKCHDELAKIASAILLGTVGSFENSAFAEKETK